MRGLDNCYGWFTTYIRILLIGWLSFEIMASNKIFKDDSMSTKFSSSNTKFSLAMYKHLAGLKKNENIFYSPFSISASLSMALLGAKTSTLQEMMKALAFEDLGQNVHEAYEVYLKDIMAGNDNFTLNAANRIYPHVKAKLVRDYLNLCTKHYHADITPLDYSNSPGPARETINKWVSDQTAGKIKDLIPDGVLNDLTIAVLVNAIYFKGNWASQFKTSFTKQMPFQTASGEKIQVQMMFQNENFNYMHSEEMKLSALEMPYKGNHLSMMFVLPDTVDGLSALEEKLTPNLLSQITSSMKSRKTEVYLPRFKMEAEFELSSILSEMGMPEAFSDVADFSGMDESKQTYISKVFHKGFVEVNEEGAEAAAATGTVMMTRCLPITMEFRADHPFLFFINDKRSNVILFAGRLAKPPSDSQGQQREVIHKAFVEVNEEGAEAAAATAVIKRKKRSIPVKMEFRADHPFLFFINDKRSDVILFAGKLVKPPSDIQEQQQREDL